MLREAGRLQPQGSMLRGWEEQRLLLGGGPFSSPPQQRMPWALR